MKSEKKKGLRAEEKIKKRNKAQSEEGGINFEFLINCHHTIRDTDYRLTRQTGKQTQNSTFKIDNSKLKIVL